MNSDNGFLVGIGVIVFVTIAGVVIGGIMDDENQAEMFNNCISAGNSATECAEVLDK